MNFSKHIFLFIKLATSAHCKYHSAGIKWNSVEANEDLHSEAEGEDQIINLFFLLCTLDYGKVLGIVHADFLDTRK